MAAGTGCGGVAAAEGCDIFPEDGGLGALRLGCAGVDEVAEGLEGGAGGDVGELRD